MGFENYVKNVEDLIQDIKETQGSNIKRAAEIIAESIMNGGILQAFGSGHSYAAALEICGRAGGLIPSKIISENTEGFYEKIEGVGTALAKKIDVRENDCFVIISNSGRNPFGIELADWMKKKGNKIIVVTSLEVSKSMSSRHSSGKNLYEFADVVLDNRGVEGDSVMEIPGIPIKVCATSSISAALLLQSTIYEAILHMTSKGFIPPVYMSANVDGGPEFNNELETKYADRIFRKY